MTTPFMLRVLEAKAATRSALAKRPFHEKIGMVVWMQKRNAPILEARGKTPIIWQLDPGEGEFEW